MNGWKFTLGIGGRPEEDTRLLAIHDRSIDRCDTGDAVTKETFEFVYVISPLPPSPGVLAVNWVHLEPAGTNADNQRILCYE